MNLKKGLSFVAFGFFFTLVNVNLRLNGTAVNITPDFVGWILLFLAFDKLGDYVAGKVYIKWLSLLLIVMSAAEWIYEVVKPELDTGAVKTFNTVLGGIYMFLLLGVLAEIARDYSSPRAGILGVLRFLNPALLLGFVLTGITGVSVGTGEGVPSASGDLAQHAASRTHSRIGSSRLILMRAPCALRAPWRA